MDPVKALDDGSEALDRLLKIAREMKGSLAFLKSMPSIAKDSARVAAAIALLDRGWGKPGQHHQHEGDPRQYVISGEPLTTDEWKAKYCRA